MAKGITWRLIVKNSKKTLVNKKINSDRFEISLESKNISCIVSETETNARNNLTRFLACNYFDKNNIHQFQSKSIISCSKIKVNKNESLYHSLNSIKDKKAYLIYLSCEK